jgi:DNA polymerase
LTPQQTRTMVSTFRTKYFEVVDYWGYLQKAFYAAVTNHNYVHRVGAVKFGWSHGAVYIELPSGRRIHYLNPEAWRGEKGIEIRYDGLRNGVWSTIRSWGGVLTENVVQAISRDILTEGMYRAEAHGMPIIGHSHDEIITEVDLDFPLAHQALSMFMSQPIEWAPGLPLAAEGWEGERYIKA